MKHPGSSASPSERSGPCAGDWRSPARGRPNSRPTQVSGVASAFPSAVLLESRPTDRPGLPHVRCQKPIDWSLAREGDAHTGEGVLSLVSQAVGRIPGSVSFRPGAVRRPGRVPRVRASRRRPLSHRAEGLLSKEQERSEGVDPRFPPERSTGSGCHSIRRRCRAEEVAEQLCIGDDPHAVDLVAVHDDRPA